MKTKNKKHWVNKSLLLIAAALILFPISSCAQKLKFSTSSVVPAAQGTVKVKKDNNNNFLIKIHIDNLADPQRLTPSRSVYVVWLVTDENSPQNIGEIVTSKKFLSSKLQADFQSVSSTKPTRIFITAEKESGMQNPYNEVILTTQNF